MPVGLGRRFLARVRRAHAIQAAAPVGAAPPVSPPPSVGTQAHRLHDDQGEPVPTPNPGPAASPGEPHSERMPTPPRIEAAATPEPVEPEPRAVPGQQQPQVVSLAARATSPREWNLWELERLARATAGSDAARDEERGYILMYLRDFANADGALPADFDVVVRESFGDVLDAVHS